MAKKKGVSLSLGRGEKSRKGGRQPKVELSTIVPPALTLRLHSPEEGLERSPFVLACLVYRAQ